MITSQLLAGGISGYVSDSKDRGKSGVRVTVKYGNQANSTSTNSKGYYVLEIPAIYAGVKGKVYVSNITSPVARCTIPADGYNKVNVKLK